MEEKVMLLLNDICGAEDGELEMDMDLFELGLLDSFGTVQLLVEIELRFGVALDIGTLSREEFSTPSLIIRKIQQEMPS